METASEKDIRYRLKSITSQLDRVEMELAQARVFLDIIKYELLKTKIGKS